MKQHEKVSLELDSSLWHKENVERIWAEPIEGGSGSLFIAKNTPFFAKNLSFLDTIQVQKGKDPDGNLYLANIVERSGHSTYRILENPANSNFQSYWKKLEAMGCSYESTDMYFDGIKKRLLAVDVPASTNIFSVYSILGEGEKDDVWMFEEGHCGHKLD